MSPEEVHRLTFRSLVTGESCINNNKNNNNKNEAPQQKLSPQQRPHSLTKDDINPSSPDIDNVSSENK